jgi:cytochrome c553
MNKFSLSALVSACVLIAAPTHAADVAAGKAKAEDSCVDCHGDDGKGDDKVPSIAGMPVAKFTKAIEEYQADVRAKTSKDPKGAAKMTKEAKKLSAADVANVAAYYASLK